MPVPAKGESERKFVARCMAYPDLRSKPPKQRAGECYGIYRSHKEEKSADRRPGDADSEKTQPATGVKQDEENRAVAAALRKKRNDGRLKKAADFLAAYRKAKLLCQEGGAGPVEDVAGTAKGGKKGCGGECACKACAEKAADTMKCGGEGSGVPGPCPKGGPSEEKKREEKKVGHTYVGEGGKKVIIGEDGKVIHSDFPEVEVGTHPIGDAMRFIYQNLELEGSGYRGTPASKGDRRSRVNWRK